MLDFLAVVLYLYCCYSLRRKKQHLRMSRAGYNGKKVNNSCIQQELHTCLGRGETCECGMIVHRLAMVHRISMLCSLKVFSSWHLCTSQRQICSLSSGFDYSVLGLGGHWGLYQVLTVFSNFGSPPAGDLTQISRTSSLHFFNKLKSHL